MSELTVKQWSRQPSDMVLLAVAQGAMVHAQELAASDAPHPRQTFPPRMRLGNLSREASKRRREVKNVGQSNVAVLVLPTIKVPNSLCGAGACKGSARKQKRMIDSARAHLSRRRSACRLKDLQEWPSSAEATLRANDSVRLLLERDTTHSKTTTVSSRFI